MAVYSLDESSTIYINYKGVKPTYIVILSIIKGLRT